MVIYSTFSFSFSIINRDLVDVVNFRQSKKIYTIKIDPDNRPIPYDYKATDWRVLNVH